jgi:hypothetical protein
VRAQRELLHKNYVSWDCKHDAWKEEDSIYVSLDPLKAKHVCGSGGIAPSFLISTIEGCEWSASRPNRFTSQKEPIHPPHPLDMWLGGPKSRSGRSGEKVDEITLRQ